MLPIYTKQFNTMLDNSIFPDEWLIGMIKPIFKNKGSRSVPENYRPITLLCCSSKLLITILNKRLNHYLDVNNILSEAQTAFRQGCSTTDNLFNIHSLIEILKRKKKKLLFAFVDFQKEFDMISRSFLWQKLLNYNINGKFIRIIHKMYQDIKSCVIVNNKCSNLFPCSIGVRQGENLSSLLLSIYLNDLEHNLLNFSCTKLFDTMVLPILLYGFEIWGYETLDIIENIHINFLRRLLPIRKSTPIFMLYGELGRTLLKRIIDQRIIEF